MQGMNNSTRSWALLAGPTTLLASLTLLLAACSGGSVDGKSSPTPAAIPTASVSEAEATPAVERPVVITTGQGDAGPFLVGPTGGSLYVFLRDAPDSSSCAGDCLQAWPPLLATAGGALEAAPALGGAFGSIETTAGSQVTYNNAPLYYFAGDSGPGDTMGHSVGDVWFLARPETTSTSVVSARGSGMEAFLVGPTGMTLYLFANDAAGVSNCSGGCLERWPALTLPDGLDATSVAAASGDLSVIMRDEGSRQVAYDGLPLYYFAGDGRPGDTNGDGVGGVWSLARP